MEFYTALGRYYDQVFPLGQDQLSCLTRHLDRPGPVVDLACGTGTYARALGEKGYQVVALDLDEEMVRQAREKTAELPVRVLQADMRKVAVLLQEQAAFSGAYCIGNSISHLHSPEEIATFCRDVAGLMKPRGVFLVQTVNYDRVLQERVTELPVIKTGEVEFVRKYIYEKPGDPIEFVGELSYAHRTGTRRVTNSVRLYPLLSRDLERILLEAGFTRVALFGNFREVPHSLDTPATVAIAWK